jgi:hypothetical protein
MLNSLLVRERPLLEHSKLQPQMMERALMSVAPPQQAQTQLLRPQLAHSLLEHLQPAQSLPV